MHRGSLVKKKRQIHYWHCIFFAPLTSATLFLLPRQMQLAALSISFARCIKPPVVIVYLAFAGCGNYPRCSPALGISFNCKPQLLCSCALGSPASQQPLERGEGTQKEPVPWGYEVIFSSLGWEAGLGVVTLPGDASAVSMWINCGSGAFPSWPQRASRLSQGCTRVLHIPGHPKRQCFSAQKLGSNRSMPWLVLLQRVCFVS